MYHHWVCINLSAIVLSFRSQEFIHIQTLEVGFKYILLFNFFEILQRKITNWREALLPTTVHVWKYFIIQQKLIVHKFKFAFFDFLSGILGIRQWMIS